MRKNNIWNKIFHNKELNNNIINCKQQVYFINSYKNWLNKINKANSLMLLMIIHRRLITKGYSMSIISIDSPHIKNKSISYWEKSRNNQEYESALLTYKKMLKTSILDVVYNAEKLITQYKSLNYVN